MITIEQLTTPRLTLLPLHERWAPEMSEALSAPALHEFTGGHPLTAEALTTRYRRLAAGSPDPRETWLNWLMRHNPTQALTGYVQATLADDQAELAWVTAVPWQGQGLATEAATAMTSWLRTQGIRHFTAHIHPQHPASATVATALGLHRTQHRQAGEDLWTT